MNTAVQRLRNDHKRLIQLLFCLDREVQGCRAGRRPSSTAVARIIDALDYIQGYPENWHHPIEDLAFSRLLKKDRSQAGTIEGLIQEHAILEEQTSDLHDRYEQCLNEGRPPDHRLLKSTYSYLNRQLKHQKRENDLVFPLLAEHLDAGDWMDIERRLGETPRQTMLQRHYLSLFNRLVRGSPSFQC